MELNLKLDAARQELLRTVTDQAPIYCVQTELDRQGHFGAGSLVGMTESVLFVFEANTFLHYPLKECETVVHRPQANGVLLNVKYDGAEHLLVRGSMRDISRLACIARGARLLIAGDMNKRVINRDKETVCRKCGRVLPGTNLCPKCDGKHQNLKRLKTLCRPHLVMLIAVFLLMSADTTGGLLQQHVLRLFVDGHLSSGRGTVLDVLLFCGIYSGLILLGLGIYYGKSYLCGRLGVKVAHQLRGMLNEKLQQLSLSFIHKRYAGELMERVTGDTNHVQDFISNCICNAFNQVIYLIALAIIMLMMNWKLALAAFAFAPLVLLFTKTFWPHIRRIFHGQWRKKDRIQNKLQDVLSGIRIVKTYGKESAEIREFCRLNDELVRVQSRNEKFFATFFPLLTLTLSVSSYLIVYLGGLEVLSDTMTPGALMQFIAYSGMLMGPLSYMSFLPRRIIQMTTSMERIYDVLDEEPEIKSGADAVSRDIRGDIELQNVVFGYHAYDPVLEGINLTVKKGEMIGLVGSSGCGKSTFINLLMRLYDPDEGRILVDGIDLKEYDLAAYHRQIGVVLQETFLFAGTVLSNIRFAKPEATEREVILAAKAANAHEFICKLPDGYNTYIGERGHNLSGGEKQRIAIARAILNDPKILILDEATSALDTESEYQVQQALERLRKDRTTFAIAHRLSTLRCADRLLVINDHKIAELGTHNELLKQKGIYYSLVMAQLQMNKTADDL